MSYTAPADLPAQWRASAATLEAMNNPELRPGIVALRECADALAESLYANASAYLDRLGIPALGRPVATPACPPTTHSIDECEPPSVPVSPPCTCGHPRSDHAYYADGCWPDNGFDHCTCRTYTPKR